MAEARAGRAGVGDDRDAATRAAGRPGPATLGVEALLEVQRRGLEAAGDLVDRLVLAVDGRGDPADGRGNGDDGLGRDDVRGGAGPPSGGAGAADDLVRFWIEVVQRGLDAFASVGTVAADGARPGAATFDLAGRSTNGVVGLTAGADGAEIWVHNGGDGAYEEVELHCGDLRSPDGAVLPADDVAFDPPAVALGPRSSRGVVVTARAAVAPGTYRGMVQCGVAPGSWVPIEVLVPVDAEA